MMLEPQSRSANPACARAALTDFAGRCRGLSRAEVADDIRRRVICAELDSGQRLVEAELCESLGAGRGAVRLALSDLVRERLIERVPNCGARVPAASLRDAQHLAEVHAMLERLIVGRSACLIDEGGIGELLALRSDLEAGAASGDVCRFVELTLKVVGAYARIAEQPMIAGVLAELAGRKARHLSRLGYWSKRMDAELPVWLGLIDAICSGNSRVAEAALERRIRVERAAMLVSLGDREDREP